MTSSTSKFKVVCVCIWNEAHIGDHTHIWNVNQQTIKKDHCRSSCCNCVDIMRAISFAAVHLPYTFGIGVVRVQH